MTMGGRCCLSKSAFHLLDRKATRFWWSTEFYRIMSEFGSDRGCAEFGGDVLVNTLLPAKH